MKPKVSRRKEIEKIREEMNEIWDVPGGRVVKNSPSNAGDMGSIPGHETKFPHATGQLSPCPITREKPAYGNYRAHVLWSPQAAMKDALCRN